MLFRYILCVPCQIQKSRRSVIFEAKALIGTYIILVLHICFLVPLLEVNDFN